MKFSGKIYAYFIIILACSTIITIAGIYGFQRLEPAINALNIRNTQSLYYAEQMFVSISAHKDIDNFETYLYKAKNNITEPGEADAVKRIADIYKEAFRGNHAIEEQTINEITSFAEINRSAMEKAVVKAKKQQSIEIWIILFPSIFIWIVGLTLLRRLNRVIIKPIQELNDAVFDYNKGNKMRRCPSKTYSKDLQMLYDGINHILDGK
ncbi:hypothetical protein IKQ26_07990 [bacterium]|nr:hypothetical protein [bacterium]